MPEGPPNPNYPGPCGGANEPPCAPQPAALPGKILLDWNLPIYTRNEMLAHGQACYDKGKKDAK